jgi:hypothetical protein
VTSISQIAIVENMRLANVLYYGTTFIDTNVFNGASVRIHTTTFYEFETFAKLNVSFDAPNFIHELKCPKLTCRQSSDLNKFISFSFIILFVS